MSICFHYNSRVKDSYSPHKEYRVSGNVAKPRIRSEIPLEDVIFVRRRICNDCGLHFKTYELNKESFDRVGKMQNTSRKMLGSLREWLNKYSIGIYDNEPIQS